jgi:putative SOS response-associated peptidase YedK
MPVIVPASAYPEWLDPRNADVERLDRLLVPWAGDGLIARPVGRRVNDARNQGPDLIESLGSPQGGE